MTIWNDMIGKPFELLTVKRDTGKRYQGIIIWECECECGHTIEVRTDHLITGAVRSCGCLVLTEGEKA